MALIVLRLAEVDRARVVERKSLCPGSRQIMERSVQSCRLTDDNSLSFDVTKFHSKSLPLPRGGWFRSWFRIKGYIHDRSLASREDLRTGNWEGDDTIASLEIMDSLDSRRSIPRGACVSCVLKRRRSRDEGDICSIRVGRGNCSR